jgi:hypothetical protein
MRGSGFATTAKKRSGIPCSNRTTRPIQSYANPSVDGPSAGRHTFGTITRRERFGGASSGKSRFTDMERHRWNFRPMRTPHGE